MILETKGLSPHEPAHKWVKNPGTCLEISIKAGCLSNDMKILNRIVGVRNRLQSVDIIIGGF